MTRLGICVLLFILNVSLAARKVATRRTHSFLDNPFAVSNDSSVESRLYYELFKSYNKVLRPSLKSSDATEVTIYPYIYALLDVDERSEWVKFIEWRRIIWRDQYLTWEPADYEGIDIIFLPAAKIWKPDVMIFNTVDRIPQIYPLPQKLQVHSDGSVNWVLSEVICVRCQFQVNLFPFDTQNCTLQYGTWAYSHKEIHLKTDVENVNVGFQHSNSEWQFLELSGLVRVLNYSIELVDHSFERQYGEVIFHLLFARKPTYYVFVLIIPSFIITAIAILGLFSPFTSGGERSEKVNLGLTTLLTMAIMLQIVTDSVPKTKIGLPMLGNYILYEFMVSSLGTSVAVLIMYLHHRSISFSWKPPKWLLCMTCVKHKLSYLNKLVSKLDSGKRSLFLRRMTTPLLTVELDVDGIPNCDDQQEKIKTDGEILESIRMCLRAIEGIRAIMQSNDESDADTVTWNRIFDKIDLYFMIIFLFGNIGLTCAIFWPWLHVATEPL